ncbi:SecA domain protein, partial [Mycoplasmopsis alligatoris A21JP2]
DKEITNKNLKFAFNHAQKKIEGFNYDSRKNVLNYDDVIRQQRDLIYSQRDLILLTDDIVFVAKRMISSTAKSIIKSENYRFNNGSFDFEALAKFLDEHVSNVVKIKFSIEEIKVLHENELFEYIEEKFLHSFDEWKENVIDNYDQEMLNTTLRDIVLKILDIKWQYHIDTMDKLRSNINLVQYAQKNPFQVYTDEGTKKFEAMLSDIAFDVMISIFRNEYGRKSLIDKSIRQDPIFQEMISNITYNYALTQQENEENYLRMYKSIKARLEELENNSQANVFDDNLSHLQENNPEINNLEVPNDINSFLENKKLFDQDDSEKFNDVSEQKENLENQDKNDDDFFSIA